VSAFTAPPLRFSLKPLCLAAKSGEVLATEEQGKNKGVGVSRDERESFTTTRTTEKES
jgi:hypothetical protein